jgi:hypothetical protein
MKIKNVFLFWMSMLNLFIQIGIMGAEIQSSGGLGGGRISAIMGWAVVVICCIE